MIEPMTRLPIPPLDTVANNAIGEPVMWFFAVVVGAAAVYALRHWRSSRSPTFPLILIGGALAFLLEPFLDIVGACWHPEIGQHTVITLIGRAMPTWLLPTYIAYFGVQPMLLYRAFRGGITARGIWLAFWLPVATDIVLEETLMHWDVYFYYGNQPLLLNKFPLWWAPANSLGVLAAVLVIGALVPHLRGWQRLGIALITPFAYSAMFTLVAMPSIVAVNSAFPVWSTQGCGLMTFAFAALMVHLFTQVFATEARGVARPALSAEVARA